MTAWERLLEGKFIVFDGPDGSGKTTQFTRFVEFAREQGLDVCEVREPGSTVIGERVRDILLDASIADMDPMCEMLLFMAARAQLVGSVIANAMYAGKTIITDRFITSTYAYQGVMLPDDAIRTVGELAVAGCWPHVTLVLMSQAGQSLPKAATKDRMEQQSDEYLARVNQNFVQRVAACPRDHALVNASQSPDDVFDSVLVAVAAKLGGAL